MARDEVTRAAETAWRTLKRTRPGGRRRPLERGARRIADSVVRIGESLRDDIDLRDKVDNWIIRGRPASGGPVRRRDHLDHHRDDRALGRRGRQQTHRTYVGRDLQFIRINGTVVGALAGLVIYTVAQIIF